MQPGAISIERNVISRRTAQAVPRLSIVMPCLNEAETLASCIRKAHHALFELALPYEILIADNGSLDGSQAIARKNGARVISVAEKGYGSALRGGISAAQAEWIIVGDADDSYDFGSIAPFVEKLEEGFDLVMGCRLPSGKGQIMKGAMPWKHRWIGNPVLTFLGRLFFKSPANDFHCGLRAFTKTGFARMNLSTTGMEFASEMVIKATFGKLRIAEVPVTLHKDGRSRPPHLRSWRDGWRHLRFMLQHCPLWLFMMPALVVLFAGSAFGLRLLAGPIRIGNVAFDTNTLLVCAMSVVVGVQLVFFALFARLFGAISGMLPASARFSRLMSFLKLERGLIVGLGLMLGGAGLLLSEVVVWKKTGYGALSYSQSLRQVIPAITLITTGVQFCFSSFLMSMLSLPKGIREKTGLTGL